jgi:hypothetical protein
MERLLALAETHAVDELAVLTICHDFAARKRSYTLLAEALGARTTWLTHHRAGSHAVYNGNPW